MSGYSEDLINQVAAAIYNCSLEKYIRPKLPASLKLRRWEDLTPDDYEVPMHRAFAQAALEAADPVLAQLVSDECAKICENNGMPYSLHAANLMRARYASPPPSPVKDETAVSTSISNSAAIERAE